MSIIYEALKKTQETRDKKGPGFNVKKWVLLPLIIFVSLLIGYAGYHYLPQVIIRHAKIPLTLSAIFLSANNSSALINDQIYHLGDTVNNMKIVSIDPNSVELQDRDKKVSLTLDQLSQMA